MSRFETFDDFLATEQLANNTKMEPFPLRDDKSEEATLKWLVENFDSKESAAHSRLITYRRYVSLYKGIHWRYFDVRDSHRDYEYNPRKPRIVVNYCYEMTEQKVSQMTRLNIAFTAIPHSQETKDTNAARAAKLMLDARAHEVDLEGKHIEADRVKHIFGTSFFFSLWDKDAGPMHPAYKAIKESGDKKALKKYKGPIHIGDVIPMVLAPDRVFPQIGYQNWADVQELEYIDWVHVKHLKEDYPAKANEIKENKRMRFDYEYLEISRPDDLIMVRHFYHPPTKYLPEGAYIKYTDDVILEWTEYPYDHGCFPCIVDTDIDVYNELWGRSFFTHIEQLQRLSNSVWSSNARDYGIASAPKWMMPKGACSIHDLNNELTIVEYSGPMAPQLVTSSPTPGQSFEYSDRIENKISQMSGVYDISRGEVPSGVTANSALRFLDEQESQRTVILEKKRKRRVIDVYKQMLEVMKQYYKDSDGRVIKYLGKDNQFIIKDFFASSFNSVYDIRLQNTSALPDTKTGKISAIIDLNTATQTDPVFRREEVIRMLDLGLDETFVDQATSSLDAAKQTLSMMMEGEPVPPPEIWEDLIIHHTVFYRELQKPNFRLYTPPEVQEAIKLRMKALEALMWTRAQENQMFAMKLQQLEYFPLFFTVPTPQPILPPQGQPQEGGMDTSQVESLQGAQDGTES